MSPCPLPRAHAQSTKSAPPAPPRHLRRTGVSSSEPTDEPSHQSQTPISLPATLLLCPVLATRIYQSRRYLSLSPHLLQSRCRIRYQSAQLTSTLPPIRSPVASTQSFLHPSSHQHHHLHNRRRR
ncbi:hypothetical protein M0R45_015784 [Rubus argutus]|uniref:Uncharacterized protein n=1 Tax=Rubus argutus TaxID=59490 RepID=A0AAW1XT28_RUBAR